MEDQITNPLSPGDPPDPVVPASLEERIQALWDELQSGTALDSPILDVLPGMLRATIDRALELRELLKLVFDRLMIEGKHYYYPRGYGQDKYDPGSSAKETLPILNHDGALLIFALFNLKVEPEPPAERYPGGKLAGHYAVRARVNLVNGATGTIATTGDATCSTMENNFAFRFVYINKLPKSFYANHKPQDFESRFGGYGPNDQIKLASECLADHYNGVLRIAYTRAKIVAAYNLPMVRDMFGAAGAE